MGNYNWINDDGLFLQYGTDKAIPTTGGDYRNPGEYRDVEFTLDLVGLTTTAVVIPALETTFADAGVFIEQVEVVADNAAVGGTSVSIGLIGMDRSTKPSNGDTAFVSALPIANINVDGEKNILTAGVSGAGNYVGTTLPSGGYFTALAAGTFTDGTIRVRVKYRGVPPITH
jgi:hypothetical protein